MFVARVEVMSRSTRAPKAMILIWRSNVNVKQPLKRLAALAGAAVVGLAAAALVASPADATGKGKPWHPQLNVKIELTGDYECVGDEWHVTWTLKDVSKDKRQGNHSSNNYDNVVAWTKTQTLVDQEEGESDWSDVVLDGDLVPGTPVPKKNQGELTGTQVLSGDTQWVQLYVGSDWESKGKGKKKQSGTATANYLVNLQGECGDGDTDPDPEAADPFVEIAKDCGSWYVGYNVPEGNETVDFAVTTSSGAEYGESFGPAEETYWVEYPIEDESGTPSITVAWGEASESHSYEGWEDDCFVGSDIRGEYEPTCEGLAFVFWNEPFLNEGIEAAITLESSTGEARSFTIAPGEEVAEEILADGTDPFTVDVYIDDELVGTAEWAYDEDCDDDPSGAEPTTPVAEEKMPVTGSSLTIAVVSALALALAGAALFFMVRRRRMAENW
jgi:hypothetical protein